MNAKGIQVLHVDDEPDFADLTSTFLERESDRFTVETATSAEEGLEQINDRPPDCVVSDYNMPGTDGLEFLQAVREEYPDIPFILFTGKGSEAVASEAIAVGVTDYLQKGSGTEQYELLANRIQNAVRARREAKRADRQEELMRLTEFAGDTGGFELDPETGDVLMTAGTRRILHLPEQANPAFEKNIEQYHPDDRDRIRGAVQRAVRTGEQTHGTFRYQHPDAEKQQLLDITYTPTATDGDTTIIRGAIHDVTERDERQRELRRLQQAIDDANVPITLADPSQPDQPLVYVNDAFEEMTGYAPEETLGRNCRFLQGEDTDPEKVAALRESIDNEERISVELRNYRKDGTEFWNRVTVTPIYDDDDELVRYLGTQEDITERKERERATRQRQERLTLFFEESPLGAIEWDDEFRFKRLNARAEEILGYSEAELRGELWETIVAADDHDKIGTVVENLLDADSGARALNRNVRKDGELITSEWHNRAITDAGGEIQSIFSFFQDVTERENRRRELEEHETIIETLSDAVYVLDDEGRFTYVNDEFVELVGYDRETVIGNTPSLIKDAEAVERAEDQLGRLLSSEGPDHPSLAKPPLR